MSICLFASQVAIITGHNKYKKVHELLNQIWGRYFPTDYRNTIEYIEKSKKVKLVPIKEDSEIVQDITKKNNLNLENEIKKCVTSKNVEELDNSKNDILKKVNEKKVIKKEETKSKVEKFVNVVLQIKKDEKKMTVVKRNILQNVEEEQKEEIKKILSSVNLDVDKEKVIEKISKVVDEKKMKSVMKNVDKLADGVSSLKVTKEKLVEEKNVILNNFDDKKSKEMVNKILSNVKTVEKNKDKIMKKLEDDGKKEKEELKKNLNSLGNRNFGINHENNVLRQFEEKRGVRVMEDRRFYKRKLFSTESLNWSIGGRIDGIMEDGTIVEIKNRIYRLFYKLRDYERVQIQSYMYIFRAEQGVLVEAKGGQINSIDVEFNDEAYEEIKDRIRRFASFFNEFIGNFEMKKKLLIGTDLEKESLYVV